MLRGALNHAVRTWRLRYNPAKHSVPAKPRAAVRLCWTPDEAAAFLRHNAEHYADRLTDLFEVMLGTGMRRGEILALHWSDVHLMDHQLYVRWPLTAVNNGKIHLSEPKTEASRAWISLSPRAMAALHGQVERVRGCPGHRAGQVRSVDRPSRKLRRDLCGGKVERCRFTRLA
jgi:integrase